MPRNLTNLTRYTYFPKELFRPQLGHYVQLRPVQTPGTPTKARVDLAHHQRERLRRAKVEVENLQEGFVAPKGCDLKPNTKFMQRWMIGGWRDPLSRVWIIQEGTPLPDNLVLVQQGNTQQWSIDPVGKQTLTELNDNINDFFAHNAAIITGEQWRKAYPRATEFERKIINPRGEKRPRSQVVTPLEAPGQHETKHDFKFGVRFR